MNNILAIECATDLCTVALSVNGKIFQRISHETRSNAKLLLPQVSELLSSSSISFKNLSAICVTVGPGSFTGIRIGLSVAQGLAYGSGLPVYTWTTLEVMAAARLLVAEAPGNNESGTKETDKLVITALDARMGEIYWSSFRGDDAHRNVIEQDPPNLTSVENFKQIVRKKQRSGEVIALGSGFKELASEFGNANIQIDADAKPEARSMIDLFALYSKSKTPARDPSLLTPLYLRNEITWKKRERRRQ